MTHFLVLVAAVVVGSLLWALLDAVVAVLWRLWRPFD